MLLTRNVSTRNGIMVLTPKQVSLPPNVLLICCTANWPTMVTIKCTSIKWVLMWWPLLAIRPQHIKVSFWWRTPVSVIRIRVPVRPEYSHYVSKEHSKKSSWKQGSHTSTIKHTNHWRETSPKELNLSSNAFIVALDLLKDFSFLFASTVPLCLCTSLSLVIQTNTHTHTLSTSKFSFVTSSFS